MELALSFSVFAPSSSSSSNDVSAPKIAETSNAADSKVWPEPVEKQFIEILLEAAAKGNICNGIMKKDLGPVVTEEFNNRTGKYYSVNQIKENFKRLKKKYRAFSQLIDRTDMEWDSDANIVKGSDAAWLDAVKSNSKYNDFCKKGLDHYGLLRQLLPTVAQSSAQHVSAVDGDEQGSNPKGKQPAHTDTSRMKKRKAVSFARAPKSRNTVESAQVPDFSVTRATKILISMSNDLDDETMFKATEKLVKAEWREAFVNFTSDGRLAWIKYLTRSS
uniref:Myb/SANT-like domain-containing protein n=1 Tax=Quercus lobata TaxID=97700 RepID=A0A7N2N866_QUELO